MVYIWIYTFVFLRAMFYLSMLFWKLHQSWVKLSSILKHLLQKPEWKYLISLQWWICSTPVDSLCLNDTIWRQGSRSALTQIVVCCLMAPICCLSWCWLGTIIYTAVQFYSKYKKHILLSLLTPITITIIIIFIIFIIIITIANVTVIINLFTYSILISISMASSMKKKHQ